MFIQSAVWDGLKNEDMTEVYGRIGPSIAFSKRAPKPEPRTVKYQPVSSAKLRGRVTYYNMGKGFGRIGKRLYFHFSDVVDGNASFIREGVFVAYEDGINPRNGREKAVDIQLVEGVT